MRLVLLLALLAPAAGLSWLLEPEEAGHVAAVALVRREPLPPATLAPRRSVCPRPVAAVAGGVSVSGHVIGVAGRPVPGARVVARDYGDVVVEEAITDAQGAFLFGGAHWDGTIEVDAGVRGRARVWLAPEDRRDLRIGLVSGAVLRGRVLAPDGETPVVDAAVVAEEDEFGRVDVRTKGDGSFLLSPIPRTREFELRVDAGARGRVLLANVLWAQAGSLDVVLERVRPLHGRVVRKAEEGELVGVAGVRVCATEPLRGKPSGDGTTTDEDGRFTCHVYGWEGCVEVTSDVWYQARGAEAFQGAGEVVTEVRRRGTLCGRCELADGTPVAGAVVTCSDSFAADPVVSDVAGRFEIARVGILRTQGVGLRARKGGLVGRRCVTKSPEPGYEPVVVLRPTASVRGRVLDEEGEPAANAWVMVAYVPDPVDEPEEIEWEYEDADGEGRFLVTELPVGPCEVELEAPGYAPSTFQVRAGLQGTSLGVVRLVRLPEQRGRVVDPQGTELSSATYLLADGAGRAIPVRPDGSFVLDLPEDPESEVEFAAPGFVPCNFEVQDLPHEDPWCIVLERAPTLAGRVLDARGQPITAATLSATGLEHDGEGWACVDTAGHFCMALTRPGIYELEVYGGQHGSPDPLVVHSGARDLILRQEALPGIRGRVVGPTGRGLAGAGVSAWDADVGRSTTRQVLTDENGCFVLAGLTGLAWHLDAVGLPQGTRAARMREVSVGTDAVTLEAMRTLSIEGRILGFREGAPGAYGVRIEALDHEESSHRATVLADGSFRVDDLLPGLHEVRGWRGTGLRSYARSTPVRVHAGTENVLLLLQSCEDDDRRR